MRRVTVFSFGYYGWGNSTEQLVKAVDAVEKARGFRPPIFVDVRIRRQGRARGFIGNAYGDLLGANRHHWMSDLGNERILSGSGRRIQIRRPQAATELLHLTLEAGKEDCRVIFFCGCQWPKWEGQVNCHRHTVGTLLVAAARRGGVRLNVVEWPGGKPQQLDLALSAELFRSVGTGRMSIPIPNPRPLAEYAGLPWGSIATFHAGGESLHRLVGPAQWERGQWVLPVEYLYFDPLVSLERYWQRASAWRRQTGMMARAS